MWYCFTGFEGDFPMNRHVPPSLAPHLARLKEFLARSNLASIRQPIDWAERLEPVPLICIGVALLALLYMSQALIKLIITLAMGAVVVWVLYGLYCRYSGALGHQDRRSVPQLSDDDW
jgi:hypothetical protein